MYSQGAVDGRFCRYKVCKKSCRCVKLLKTVVIKKLQRHDVIVDITSNKWYITTTRCNLLCYIEFKEVLNSAESSRIFTKNPVQYLATVATIESDNRE